MFRHIAASGKWVMIVWSCWWVPTIPTIILPQSHSRNDEGGSMCILSACDHLEDYGIVIHMTTIW